MIKEAEPPHYLVPLHSVSIYNAPPPFGAFNPHPVVSAVTMRLLVTGVIKTCGSYARQIVSPAADTQGLISVEKRPQSD